MYYPKSELVSCDTLPQLIDVQAKHFPFMPAVVSASQIPLTYRAFFEQASTVVAQLNHLGLGRGDRIALVLPNGPEMAVAFVCIASGATCAPLNPNYRASEFEFYLTDLNARALVVQEGIESPAMAVAEALNIPVLTLTPSTDEVAGSFTLNGEASQDPVWAEADDVALVLHTSGTTAKPKIVPLTQANLCASGRNIAATLCLTPQDRCFNVMPLFHIHGLIGALLSSLTAGASVHCTLGFSSPEFFESLDTAHSTWYTAVPTMHQAILARAASDSVRPTVALRFVRSSSAALPPQVMAELETLFDAPVLEAYGMTEATHQMACNPLPPQTRKPGSVGLPAGPEIAIMDELGVLLPIGQTGEIVIRGANVTPGYDGNPAANATAFTQGWFRTGDQGYFDHEGYLFLTGRLKELINRGGEKISPREIDEVLLDHPTVAQAVTFAAPHVRLGEQVMAAIVLRSTSRETDQKRLSRELREFVATRLTDFKVPARIFFLEEIPKGPTGKVQRIGLAEKLGVTDEAFDETDPIDDASEATPMEALIIDLCKEVLGREEIHRRDNFFALGGDSLLAARLLARLSEKIDVTISLVRLFEVPTISGLAQTIAEALIENDSDAETRRLLAELELLSDDEAEALLSPKPQ